MTERDTAFMAIGTAFGGLQTPLIKRLAQESPSTGREILTSTSGMLAIAIGLAGVGVGVGTRLGYFDLNRDIAAFAFGYGLSAIISISLNVIFSP
ncbi:MAG TPA: hypothetical protein PLW50_00680 [Smithellaceae bacterium]|nr:hypothetical protein [Smithellaceae bacterium]